MKDSSLDGVIVNTDLGPKSRAAAHPKRRGTVSLGIESNGSGGYRVTALCSVSGNIQSLLDSELRCGDDAKGELARLGYTKGTAATLVVLRHEVRLERIRIPSSDPVQIAQMLPHEIQRLSHWADEEVAYSYEIQNHDVEGYAHVLVALTRFEELQIHIEALRALGIFLSRIEVSTQSLTRLLVEDGTYTILWTSKDAPEYLRAEGGHIVFSRGAVHGTSLTSLFEDATSIDVRRHGEEGVPSEVLIVGDSVDLSTSTDASLRHFKQEEYGALKDLDELSESSFARVGAALAPVDSFEKGNLLPETEARKWAWRSMLRDGRNFLIAMLWALGVLYGLAYAFVSAQEEYVRETEIAVQALRSEAGSLETQWQQLQLLRGEFRAVSAPLVVVLELYERTPNAVAISHMRYDARRGVVLSGEASSHAEVLAYLEALRESAIFVDAKLASSSQPPSGRAVDFKITCAVAEEVQR